MFNLCGESVDLKDLESWGLEKGIEAFWIDDL
jgi:hypothetical protein